MRARPRRAIGRVLVAVIVLVLVGLSGLAFVLYQQTAIKPSTVTFELGFTPNASDAPYYYGLAQGYYKQNNINLTIIPGTSATATLAALEAGKVMFSEGQDSELLSLIANSNETNLRLLALVYEKTSLVVVYNNATIKNISELNGQPGSMVSPSSGPIWPVFTDWAKINDLNVSSMKIQYNPVATSNDLLLEGKVQFIVVSLADYNNVQSTGESEGLQFGYNVMADSGLNSSGTAIVTTESMIQSNPSLVQAFVKATMQSDEAAYKNPAAAVTALVAANTQLNYTSSLSGFEQLIDCCSLNPAGLSALQYGYMNPQFMQQSLVIAETADGLPLSLNASSSIYTNQFVQPP